MNQEQNERDKLLVLEALRIQSRLREISIERSVLKFGIRQDAIVIVSRRHGMPSSGIVRYYGSLDGMPMSKLVVQKFKKDNTLSITNAFLIPLEEMDRVEVCREEKTA
jgi:hypothetical protein